jgi:hypothetical protein
MAHSLCTLTCFWCCGQSQHCICKAVILIQGVVEMRADAHIQSIVNVLGWDLRASCISRRMRTPQESALRTSIWWPKCNESCRASAVMF